MNARNTDKQKANEWLRIQVHKWENIDSAKKHIFKKETDLSSVHNQ